MKAITKLADEQENLSGSKKFRDKRFALFLKLFKSVPIPLKILDVGGRQKTWERQDFCQDNPEMLTITILNVEEVEVNYHNIKSVIGDARNMQQFADDEFDIVFSNSVIEHVGNYKEQYRMAQEVQRVGKRYFLPTPNRYFPIEPHFLFPCFQFLPLWLKMLLVRNFTLGWRQKTTDKEEARKLVKSVRLLTKKELREFFPNALIYEEKLLFFTKSFIVYEGWILDV
ncbi:MAG: methyltransferase domain-containing protein [Rhizonema sp. PD37]|nr:methyltransferase domain-containing protein [Rhizonema sp. PD37]